jgi:hypothetical protein
MRSVSSLFIALVTGVFLCTAACEDEPTRPPVASDVRPNLGAGGGSSPGDGGVGAGDAGDAGSCTDLPNTGAEVPQNAVIDDLATGTGGTVADGIYDLAEARILQGSSGLPGPTGFSYQGSIRLTGQAYERVLILKTSGGASSETRSSGTFVPTGTSAAITITCPAVSPAEQVTYTAGADRLTVSNLITKESFVFTRKP